jgi:multidrug efflux pump subunit AcrB
LLTPEGGATVFLKDVAQVRDGYYVQQNVVRENGRRSVLISIIKNGNASTVEVVKQVKEALKVARKSAPPGMEITELFDQSVFVTESVNGGLQRRGSLGRVCRSGRQKVFDFVASSVKSAKLRYLGTGLT